MTIPIGKRIAAARHHANFTQQQLADRMGLSKSLIAHWERGARIPKVGQIKHLARICEVDPVTIFLADSHPKPLPKRLLPVSM